MVHDFLINESIANIHLTSPPLPTRQPMPVSENEMLTHSLAEFVLTLYTTTQPSPTCKLTHLFLSSTYLFIVLVFTLIRNINGVCNNFPSPPIQRCCCCYRDGMETITSLLLCLNRRTQCSSLHSKAMWLIMKAAIVMWLSRLLSSIRDTIILTNHNQPPHVILNLKWKFLLSAADPPAIWQHPWNWTLDWTELPVLCVRVYSAVQCSTVLYTLYVLYYCGCMYLGWAGTGDLPSWPRVPGVGGPATRYIYFHYVY